jgi:hypothetical protein
MGKPRYSQTVQWYAKRAWNVASQREIDRLYDEIHEAIAWNHDQKEQEDLIDLYDEFLYFNDLSATEDLPMPIMESVLPD